MITAMAAAAITMALLSVAHRDLPAARLAYTLLACVCLIASASAALA